MKFFYAGLNNSGMFRSDDKMERAIIDKFTEFAFEGVTDLEIGWNYLIFRRGQQLFICGHFENDDSDETLGPPLLLELPENSRCKQAVAGKESVIVLSTTNDIWLYKIHEKHWKKVLNFICADDDAEINEFPVKIFHGGCTVSLTNLGRIYNIPTLVEMPKRVKFVDVACGFDHSLMLTENGEVYTMGMGTRGQLGHGDLEDCDDPRLVETLAGLRVVQIAANGWHNAVVTDQGDLYAWGWNTNGELGVPDDDTKIFASPIAIDFKDDEGTTLEVTVKRVQCGNVFTICMLDDNTLWGCGSNKYGQLGQPQESLKNSKIFVKLNTGLDEAAIISFKCHEWGSVINCQ